MREVNPITTGWERMAELWIKSTGMVRDFSPDEQKEFNAIMIRNATYWMEVARLKNLSLMAHMTNDTDEQHKICAAIEELYETGKTSFTHK